VIKGPFLVVGVIESPYFTSIEKSVIGLCLGLKV